MTATQQMLLSAVLLVAGYAILANRMLVFGKRFRRRALDLGSRLLDDPSVSNEIKAGVERWLVAIPSRSQAWLFAALIIPAVVCHFWFKLTGRTMQSPNVPSRSSHYWKTWDEFTDMAIIASLCNSPAAAAIFIVEIIFASFLVSTNVIVGVLFKSIISRQGDDRVAHGHT